MKYLNENFHFNNIVPYFPFIVLFFILFFIHITFGTFGDDILYRSIVNNQPVNIIWDKVIFTYYDWSSRALINFNSLLFIYLPYIIWKIVNSLIIVGMAMVLPGMFSKKRNLKNNIIASIIILLFYLVLEETLICGPIATNLNYTWPLFFLFLNLYLLKNYILNQRSDLSNIKRGIVYILLIYSLIFACNHEQVLISTTIIYFFIILYSYYKDKTLNKTLLFMFILIILSGVFIATCPGNFRRLGEETKNWWPEFAEFSIFNKTNIGISAIYRLFVGNSIVSLTFLLVFGVYNYIISKRNLKIGLITSIPFIISIIICLLVNFQVFPELNVFMGSLTSYTLFTSPMNYLFDLFYLIITGSAIYGMYNIYNKKGLKTFSTLFILLLAGFATTFVMGFTPTLVTSLSRMYLPFQGLLCICIYFMLMQILNKTTL